MTALTTFEREPARVRHTAVALAPSTNRRTIQLVALSIIVSCALVGVCLLAVFAN